MPSYPYRHEISGTFTIDECAHSSIVHLAKDAARYDVNLNRDTKNTTWLRAIDDATGLTIACAAVLWGNNGVARVKGLFVLAAFRKRGVADTINDQRLALVRARGGFREVEAFTRATQRWERRGFVVVGVRPNGHTKVLKLLL